jgi:AIR synthase-related protein
MMTQSLSPSTPQQLLETLAERLLASRGLAHKRDINDVIGCLAQDIRQQFVRDETLIGDDCACLRDTDGWLLFAIEGFLNEFVHADPYFAGYCGVMVNVSDIYAMGGRPIAVVDAIWSRGQRHATPVLEGLRDAARRYGVALVGGHSNLRNDREQLSVAILGRAKRLLSSFDAKPGDVLLAAIDLRGRYREAFANWDASSDAPDERLRTDLEVLPLLAEEGLCRAAKDISQAGVIGTTMMLLECSGLGASLHVHSVPRPSAVDIERWLLPTFPSYGFVLAVHPDHIDAVRHRFTARDIACEAFGECDDSGVVRLNAEGHSRDVWDFSRQSLIGCGPRALSAQEPLHA